MAVVPSSRLQHMRKGGCGLTLRESCCNPSWTCGTCRRITPRNYRPHQKSVMRRRLLPCLIEPSTDLVQSILASHPVQITSITALRARKLHPLIQHRRSVCLMAPDKDTLASNPVEAAALTALRADQLKPLSPPRIRLLTQRHNLQPGCLTFVPREPSMITHHKRRCCAV